MNALEQGGLSWVGPADFVEIELNAAFSSGSVVAIGAVRRQKFAHGGRNVFRESGGADERSGLRYGEREDADAASGEGAARHGSGKQ
jgi:hypothetical protein